MLLKTDVCSIPVRIKRLSYFPNGVLHRVLVIPPKGSVPSELWVNVSDDNGRWIYDENGQTALSYRSEPVDQITIEVATGVRACSTCANEGIPSKDNGDDSCWECGRKPT